MATITINRPTASVYHLAAALMHGIDPADAKPTHLVSADGEILPAPERTALDKINGTGNLREDDFDRMDRITSALAAVLSLRGGGEDDAKARHEYRPAIGDSHIEARQVNLGDVAKIERSATDLLGWRKNLLGADGDEWVAATERVDGFLAGFFGN